MEQQDITKLFDIFESLGDLPLKSQRFKTGLTKLIELNEKHFTEIKLGDLLKIIRDYQADYNHLSGEKNNEGYFLQK